MAELVCVLEYLEMKKVAHRDLKPENLLLDERNHFKISDFGSAIEADGHDQANFVPGTRE